MAVTDDLGGTRYPQPQFIGMLFFRGSDRGALR
ncbi:hypothetical protein PPSIR1_28368 [Plesiocystis pacifica SIR-1]|uniref:Uncharacterized protein n=1 Tax=Plesiocystis pacifica SIR-1 TaxID=391625 RepID=A6FZU6_9BACT|nr:hypothetical protein PPSIR1_28368 [Plesiocystis pacifica SIR-1]